MVTINSTSVNPCCPRPVVDRRKGRMLRVVCGANGYPVGIVATTADSQP